ncbi:MAG: LysM peptidoglycan-binding domain-containing protein [Bacteroidaceae bacterium]|nr:LysM peptidoglycan-binding domain-containing protein [Bacteroidaceae bacterium]
MKHLLTIIATIILLAGCTPKVKEAISIPTQMETKIASIHIVNKDESLYKIASKYNITPEEIIEFNPTLKNKKLKKGMKLYIPFATTKEEDIKEDTIKKVEQPVQQEEEKNIAVKVAVILPFLLDKYAPSEQERMIEFYQGFLLAVETLKNEGHSFDIHTYDSGESTESLDKLIADGNLDKCDIIIGSLYPSHNKQLAIFAKQNNIPLVLPFTVKEEEIYSNPKAYIANALQKYIIEKSVEKFIEKYSEANIIFVKNEHDIEEKEFATHLKENIKNSNISYTEIITDSLISMAGGSGTDYITSCMNPEATNIFIPTSSKVETFNTILPTLLVLKRDTLSTIPEFTLFGYPEWQIYASSNLEAMYEVDTYFYTSFFTNNILPEAVDIQARYTQWYNHSMQNRYPRYGMLGYDIGYYFLKAASIYGTKMDENINNIKFAPTQSGFNFVRNNNRGSYINDKVYFIHYSPEYKIIKIDLDQ